MQYNISVLFMDSTIDSMGTTINLLMNSTINPITSKWIEEGGFFYLKVFNAVPGELYNCSEDFYRDEDTGFCTPDCFKWSPLKAGNTLLLISSLTGLLLSSLVFIISCLRAKTVYAS